MRKPSQPGSDVFLAALAALPLATLRAPCSRTWTPASVPEPRIQYAEKPGPSWCMCALMSSRFSTGVTAVLSMSSLAGSSGWAPTLENGWP